MPPSVFKEQNNCKIYACTLYDEITKKLIKDLKYHNKKILASLQAKIMYEYWLDLHKKENFLILPVPRIPDILSFPFRTDCSLRSR